VFSAGADEVLWGCRRASYNFLAGSIPTEIGQMTSLTGIEIVNSDWEQTRLTKMTGSIPTEVGRLTRLRQMDVWRNEFTGPLPTEVGLIGSAMQYL
jgi:hypothetical protein